MLAKMRGKTKKSENAFAIKKKKKKK